MFQQRNLNLYSKNLIFLQKSAEIQLDIGSYLTISMWSIQTQLGFYFYPEELLGIEVKMEFRIFVNSLLTWHRFFIIAIIILIIIVWWSSRMLEKIGFSDSALFISCLSSSCSWFSRYSFSCRCFAYNTVDNISIRMTQISYFLI